MEKIHFKLFPLLMLFFAQVIFAQTVNITGTVTSKEDSQPLPGASVFIEKTSIGGVTAIGRTGNESDFIKNTHRD